MENLPESLFADPTGAGPSSNPSPIDLHSASVDQLILLLRQPEYREDVLFLLNKKRTTEKDIGLPLWNSFNTVYILLQEVVSIYKSLSPEKLTTRDSNRVCNALALFQCMASHPDTRMSFIKAKIPVYLYPFLNTTDTDLPFEYLRLTSLGVIGALVKVEDSNAAQVVYFLLETGLFPLCLRCMELGNELAKTVATFVVSKILMQEEGRFYCCTYAERFFAVSRVLAGMVEKLAERPSQRQLKHIIHCYLSMSEMPRSCDALRLCMPAKLRDTTFVNVLREDPSIMRLLQNLLHNVTTGHWSKPELVEDLLAPLSRR